MNKLREWFKRMASVDTRRIGFGAIAPKPKPPTVGLLATLPSLDWAMAREALEAGAEGLVIPSSLAAATDDVNAIIKECPRCLWGIELGDSSPESLDGLDFMVLSLSSSISVLEPQEKGRLLLIDPAWDDMRLRAADGIAVDGVIFSLFPDSQEEPRLEHLLSLKRLSMLTRKPLIMLLQRPLPVKELAVLRNGGLSAVLVPGDAQNWMEMIKETRQAIIDLPSRTKPASEVDAVLPPPLAPAVASPEREDEEEEEDEEP